ncbi:hypothetical protein BDY21DRAFT_336964 [Lineolata rhizophorae]|uniref:Uncharacterized protein n=1 Tax=Lineolata rhizophorae TaxID=578093 RepID=A0A6A6P7K8_9PEZI|nr:hypothetical protein BDY21DRAFT_336964 [Lineolata rhizophorae]
MKPLVSVLLPITALALACRAATLTAQPKPEPTQPALFSCGGLYQWPCPNGFKCVDNPLDMCDPQNGGYDCPGLCVTDVADDEPAPFCMGITGAMCPEGLVCVDVPGDGCDVDQGGRDCAGVCFLGEEAGATMTASATATAYY